MRGVRRSLAFERLVHLRSDWNGRRMVELDAMGWLVYVELVVGSGKQELNRK
jgi:hypothetical protein